MFRELSGKKTQPQFFENNIHVVPSGTSSVAPGVWSFVSLATIIWRMRNGIQAIKNVTAVSYGNAAASFSVSFTLVVVSFWLDFRTLQKLTLIVFLVF